jgi:hypothetical protein
MMRAKAIPGITGINHAFSKNQPAPIMARPHYPRSSIWGISVSGPDTDPPQKGE